jgi:hypothetical protein
LVLIASLVGCRSSSDPPRIAPAEPAAPSLPTDRIAVVGASVSAGFGGAPFGDAFAAAAPRARVETFANVFLFRDPIPESRQQIDKAIAFKATAVIALDFLFWDLYGSRDPGWRDRALAAGLAELERARVAGAWIVVGDVPHVVTAADWMLAKEQIPDVATLAAANATIRRWCARERVLCVPFASWAEPLAAGGDVEVAPGERVLARTLVALDGLHLNALGAWAILDRLDHLIEATLPGTPKDALVFVRPPR